MFSRAVCAPDAVYGNLPICLRCGLASIHQDTDEAIHSIYEGLKGCAADCMHTKTKISLQKSNDWSWGRLVKVTILRKKNIFSKLCRTPGSSWRYWQDFHRCDRWTPCTKIMDALDWDEKFWETNHQIIHCCETFKISVTTLTSNTRRS